MRKNPRRAAPAIAAILLATSTVAVSADDGPAQKSFSIEAQPLAMALAEFARQADLQILFRSEAVSGLTSERILGRYPVLATLERLLEGMGLRYEVIDERTVAVSLAPKVSSAADPRPRIRLAQAEASRADTVGSAAEAQPAAIEEVIVTAQKREENLQDIPISIAVLGGKVLESRGVATIKDLVAGAVPSMRLTPASGFASTSNFGMRGLVPSDAHQISRDPAIGIYVDGIYLARAQGLGTAFFDVERIEVLRGPQGTLFGRNALGGALSIVTRKPSGELGGKLQAGVGNFNGYNVKGSLDLPRIAGVSVKLDGNWTKRDGWVDNPLAGQSDYSAIERYGGRLAALWEPTDALDVQYAFEKSRDESVYNYPHIAQLLPGAPPLAPIFSLEPKRVDRARLGVLLEPSVTDIEGHSLHITWDLSDELSLRSITGYREMGQSQSANYGGAFLGFRPNGGVARDNRVNVQQDQFSQELQLVGSSQRVKYVLGAFYFDEDAEDSTLGVATAQFNATGTAVTIIPLPANLVPDRASEAHTHSRALFGQATWTPSQLDERLHLTGGLRWTHDQKDGRLLSVRGVPSPLKFDFESKRIDPTAAVAFDWTDDINTYLRWGTAYRAGGANSRSATFRTFDEEEVETWEVGLKADLFDRRVRLNVALYHTDYRDQQLDFSSPLNPSATETINTGDKTTLRGVEVDLSVQPLPGLTLNAGYAYTEGDIPPTVNPFSGVVAPISLILTPDHAGTLAADYELEPFDLGALSLHLDANYSGGVYAYGADRTKSASYLLVNGRVTLGKIRIGGDGNELSVSLWGKNLTDEEYELFDFPVIGPGLTNAQLVFFNEPRTYGAEVAFRF